MANYLNSGSIFQSTKRVRILCRALLNLSNHLFISLAIALLPALLGVAELYAQAMWPAENIAKTSAQTTQLQTKNGQIAATISTSFVRELLDIKARFESVAGIQSEFWLTQGPAPNAWAAPSGNRNIIAFNLPMLATFKNDKDALAAVMGHEMAHLVRQHVPARKNNAAVTGMFGAFFGALFEGVIQNKYQVSGVGQDIANIGAELAKTAFSRDQEREADKFGLEWMSDAGHDLQGALRFWKKMEEIAPSGEFTFLSTHPSSVERFENLRQQIASLPARPSVTTPVLLHATETRELTAKQTSRMERMKSCNSEATSNYLQGPERTAFMKECLK